MEQFTQVLDWLLTAAPGPLTFALCICFGYFIRLVPKVSNDWIPLLVVGLGTASYAVLTHGVDSKVAGASPTFRNIIIGFILGVAAWALHKLVLARIESKFPILGDALKSADEKKPVTLPPPADSLEH